jgi:hypothetical protein
MECKIISIDQYFEYRPPNTKVPMITVHYQTDKGFKGAVDLEQNGATKESIADAVKKDAALVHSVIGASFK